MAPPPPPPLTQTIIIIFKTSLILKSGWISTKQRIKYLLKPQCSTFGEAWTHNPRSRKLVTALLNIINFEFSHVIRNVSSGFQDRPGKLQISLLSHRYTLHHWQSHFSMIRLALTWVDILLSRKQTKGCCSDCTDRRICAFAGRNWHYAGFHMTWLNWI